MNTLLVTYDLNRPGQDYKTLHEFLKGFGTWWHCVDSTWLVRTRMSASELRNELKAYIDTSDQVLVPDVTGDPWATYGLNSKCNDWLRGNL